MTIQQVISKSSALNNLVILLAKSLPIGSWRGTAVAGVFQWHEDLPVETLKLIAGLREQSADLLRAVREIGADMGAGFFPNTFTKGGVYRLVHNEVEKSAAVADGWAVATFPETMAKPGFPDLVVHNSVEKTLADKDGYRLPGLGVESGS